MLYFTSLIFHQLHRTHPETLECFYLAFLSDTYCLGASDLSKRIILPWPFKPVARSLDNAQQNGRVNPLTHPGTSSLRKSARVLNPTAQPFLSRRWRSYMQHALWYWPEPITKGVLWMDNLPSCMQSYWRIELSSSMTLCFVIKSSVVWQTISVSHSWVSRVEAHIIAIVGVLFSIFESLFKMAKVTLYDLPSKDPCTCWSLNPWKSMFLHQSTEDEIDDEQLECNLTTRGLTMILNGRSILTSPQRSRPC